MDNSGVRKLLHDLSNAVNTAKINAYLLRRIHNDALDKETMDSLDASLYEAEKLIGEYQRQIHTEMTTESHAVASRR